MKAFSLPHAALGLIGFALACEALFRVLPVSTSTDFGYHVDSRIPTYAPNIQWRFSTGWDLRHPQHLRTNNAGFVSSHDFKRDPNALGLIGDSFVEAANLYVADRPEAQLESAIGGRREVYAMGSAGTALLDYAERIRFAHERYGIRDFVVLMERGDVAQVLCDSGNVQNQCLDPRTLQPRTFARPEASTLKLLLRESALAQYLASQLKLSPERLSHSLFDKSSSPRPESPVDLANEQHRVDVITRVFFERIRPHVAGKLVIVIDCDREALMHGRPVDDPLRLRFIDLARANGAVVVDTEPLVRAHFRQSALSLDIGPYDGHFNALGVRLTMDAAARALAQAGS